MSQYSGLSSDFVVDLPVAGSYLLSLDSASAQPQPYNFVVEVPPTNVIPLSFDQVVTGDIASPGQQDVYTFNAVAGQTIVLDIWWKHYAGVWMRLESSEK